LMMMLISLPAFIIYIAAISASTNYGGVSSGFMAAALSFLSSIFLFVPPYFSLNNEQSVLSLLLFYIITVVLSIITNLILKTIR
jgi:hypothetical protein